MAFLGTPHNGSLMTSGSRIPAADLGLDQSINKSLFDFSGEDKQYLGPMYEKPLSLL
jgi:hypothetical protein